MEALDAVTIEQLLMWAGMHRYGDSAVKAERERAEACRKIINLLGAAWPCGMEEPPIVSMGDGTCGVLIDNGGDPLTPDELRGYAARLLQLAEDAEERST